MREKDKVDSVIARGKQNFDENFEALNATDIRLENNKFLNHFQIYERGTYRFLTIYFLFTSGVKNYTDQILVIYNRHWNAGGSLINRISFKILCVTNLDGMYDWKKIKGISNWINITFEHFVWKFTWDFNSIFLTLTWAKLNLRTSKKIFHFKF